MATRITSTRDLVGTNSITYIRPLTLSLRISGVRPSTKMNVFFDGVNVNQYTYPDGGALGDPLVSDSIGSATFLFEIPAGIFNTGDREIIVTDAETIASIDIVGSTYGAARGIFRSQGTEELFQTTITTRNTRIREVIIERFNWDPLAQSFFTYGVTGGCFITSIDIWFETKDSTIPISLELREMINGYPSPQKQTDPGLVVILDPANVNTSSDSSVSTKFTFPAPVYLEEDRDYCFVLNSNSNNYNVFTSKMGETSFETGRTIFEQPYVGSLFKSENQITWTAEQTEDIKFNINVASFNTESSGSIVLSGSTPPKTINGDRFTTTNGSAVVTVSTRIQHGLTGTYTSVYIQGETNGVYNGITSDNISGERTATVIDEYTFSVIADSIADTSGVIETGGLMRQVAVLQGGSGYLNGGTGTITSTSSPSYITVAAPTSGTTATVEAYILDGVVTDVTVTNPGTGYTSVPTITITDSTGSGASLQGIIDAVFTILTNNYAHTVTPLISTREFKDTFIIPTLELGDGVSGTNSYDNFKLQGTTELFKQNVVLSSYNGLGSARVYLSFGTDNPNVSPVLNANVIPSLGVYNNTIRSTDTGEENATGGTALSRYITKRISLSTVSTGIRLISDIYSTSDTDVDWYVRTSLSGEGSDHTTLGWTLLTCDTDRNRSVAPGQFFEYEFKGDDLQPFDTYDLKCVMRSINPAIAPVINRYRVIVLA